MKTYDNFNGYQPTAVICEMNGQILSFPMSRLYFFVYVVKQVFEQNDANESGFTYELLFRWTYTTLTELE